MNSRQEAKLNMYRAVEMHCDENQSIISIIPAFQNAFDNFKTKIAAVINTTQQQNVVIKGKSIDKKSVKENLSELAADIAGIIYAYAATISNNTLKQEMKVSQTALLREKDDILAPRTQNIHDAGIANLEVLKDFGITAAKLAALQTAINAYAAETPKPRTALVNRKTITKNLAALFKDADTILTDQMDKLAVAFKTENPDFLSTYENARLVVEPASTTTQLKGTITDPDGAPIPNATVTIPELGKTRKTTVNGKYNFKPLPIGKYTVTVTAENFEDSQAADVDVKLGAVNNLNVEMNGG
jgi:hypothetical protein